MSGLASFFSAFLPDKENTFDYNDSIQNVQEHCILPTCHDIAPAVDPKTLSAAEWRADRNDMLRKYMEDRMIEGESENSSEIPHVDDTRHISNTISSLDLYTKQFHLTLGVVEQVWPLRIISRREYTTSSHFEDDGPLGTLFKKVLCLELTQHTKVSTMAQAAFGATCYSRIKLYFYNKYAQRVHEFLETFPADRILVKLDHIPAKCIVPASSMEEYGWNDRDSLSPYVICIGDKSSMKLDQDGVLVKIPFDSDEVQVHMARIYKQDVVEMKLTQESVQTGILEYKQEGEQTLENEYQEYLKSRQEEKDNQQEDIDAETNHRRVDTTTANDGRAKKKARTETKYHTLVSTCLRSCCASYTS
jgi:hypothetical protein